MNTIAQNACRKIARMIWESDSHPLWVLAYRIERRFSIVGATQVFIDAQERRWQTFLAEERRMHDLSNPERISYLWR